jgi:hypothetical protein
MLFLDGIDKKNKLGLIRFKRNEAPNQQELAILVHTIRHRVAQYFEPEGILEDHAENNYFQLDRIRMFSIDVKT